MYICNTLGNSLLSWKIFPRILFVNKYSNWYNLSWTIQKINFTTGHINANVIESDEKAQIGVIYANISAVTVTGAQVVLALVVLPFFLKFKKFSHQIFWFFRGFSFEEIDTCRVHLAVLKTCTTLSSVHTKQAWNSNVACLGWNRMEVRQARLQKPCVPLTYFFTWQLWQLEK